MKAQNEDKPVFLSIGYSTCHWCHVMERESFEDPGIASFLNEHFISIKVDREERPDVDHVYMEVCRAMTGGGGWPLSIFMTPQKVPFYSGTYFPENDRFGKPGFGRVLAALSDAWKNSREKIAAVGDEILAGLNTPADNEGVVSAETLGEAERQFSRGWDAAHGGFGHAPKFPMPHVLSFLLTRAARKNDADLLRIVESTLTSIYRGGIHDHVGFGFCRYSTDERWLIPHFEKMLYDNALLLTAYSDAYRHTRNELYARAVRRTAEYVHANLTSPEGAFYSAENADSEGEEGRFYVFTKQEFSRILGPDAGLAAEYFGVTREGNFEHGKNVLHCAVEISDWTTGNGLSQGAGSGMIEAARKKLFDARSKRIHPSLDDKVLASWNGLMIAALARASQALGDASYAARANTAADFVLEHMRAPDGGLLRRWRNGEAGIAGFLEDYAFMIWGLVDLYETSFDPSRLEQALYLAERMLEDFSDDDGGLFFTARNSEHLIARTKDCYDGAMPSGNSAAAGVLARLAKLTGNTRLEDRAHAIIRAFGKQLSAHPTEHALLLSALDFLAEPSREIIIAAPKFDDAEPMLALLRSRLLPGTVLLVSETGSRGEALQALAPYTAGKRPIKDSATSYVCRDFACLTPAASVMDLEDLLD